MTSEDEGKKEIEKAEKQLSDYEALREVRRERAGRIDGVADDMLERLERFAATYVEYHDLAVENEDFVTARLLALDPAPQDVGGVKALANAQWAAQNPEKYDRMRELARELNISNGASQIAIGATAVVGGAALAF